MGTIPAFYFNEEELARVALRHSSEYPRATPFPHVVLDNFLPVEVADAILDEFPASENLPWKKHIHEHSKKLASNDERMMGLFTRHVFAQFNSALFLQFLEMLTGIKGLIADPYFEGGGLHQIEPGGYLHVHADFNFHPLFRLDRRLNLLLYLNKDWQEQYGGYLELWNREMTECEQKILPVFNRCVIFSTTDFSFHGHPSPLSCPTNRTRKSLALYYYSNGRPEEERSSEHSTLYQAGGGSPRRPHSWFTFGKFVPPILIDLARYARTRLRKNQG